MGPGIGRSIGQGFQAANHSWLAMAFYGGCFVLLFLLMMGLLIATGVPEGVVQGPAFSERTGFESVLMDQAEAQEGTSPVVEEPDLTEEPTLEDQWVAPDLGEDVDAQGEAAAVNAAERQQRAVLEWLGRSWPLLLVGFLVFLAGSTWLYGGQIGYLAKRVRGEPCSLSTFWSSGVQVFVPLLGASLLMFAATALVVLVIAVIGGALGLAGGGLAGAVGLILMLLGLVVALWVVVRLLFWFVAIVADRLGPIGGLRASVKATHGRWWKTFGLLCVMVLIFLGVSVVFGILEGIGRVVGGGGGQVLLFLSAIGQLIVSQVYLGFATSAALIRFYEDTKAPAVATQGPPGA